jgi:hypothetical protein
LFDWDVKKTLLKGDTVFAKEQLGGALFFINAALESSRYRNSASAVAAAWSSPTAAQRGSTSIPLSSSHTQTGFQMPFEFPEK